MSLIQFQSQVLDKLDYQMICYLDLDDNWVVAYNRGLEYPESEIPSSNLDFSSGKRLIQFQSQVMDKVDYEMILLPGFG